LLAQGVPTKFVSTFLELYFILAQGVPTTFVSTFLELYFIFYEFLNQQE
jgi:hypothetical protein